MAKLVDLSYTPKELEEEKTEQKLGSPPQPMYPYGTAICLCNDELEKLGLDKQELDTGDMLHLVALAKITSVTKNDTTEGQKTRVELQITQMGVSGMDEEEGEENDEQPRRKIKNPFKAY